MINKSRNTFYYWFTILSILILVGIDFFSKNFILNNFFYNKEFFIKKSLVYENFLGTSLSLLLTFNKGAAFGWFSKYQGLLLISRILVTLGMLIYLLFVKSSSKLLKISFILITSGAIGNIIDFLLYGYVIDFISFKILSYNFPIFNFADCFISIGTILLIISLIKKK